MIEEAIHFTIWEIKEEKENETKTVIEKLRCVFSKEKKLAKLEFFPKPGEELYESGHEVIWAIMSGGKAKERYIQTQNKQKFKDFIVSNRWPMFPGETRDKRNDIKSVREMINLKSFQKDTEKYF